MQKKKRLTRLGAFVEEHGLKPKRVADLTGISRQHLRRLRYGQCEPTRRVMVGITLACGHLLDRRIRVGQLFDLGDGEQ